MGGFMNSLTEVFLKVLDMSMAATWMMLAVALLRALLKKAPRSLICLMWALTAVRLLCPLLLVAGFVAFLAVVVCFFVDLAPLLLLPVVPVRPSVVWLSPG